MASSTLSDPTYVMGHSEAETQRLMLQARLYDRFTRRFLADAGITIGMTVLDVGSGSGDVAFVAADLVGPTGRVIGIDVNPAILEIAQSRAQTEQRNNVTFVAGDCRRVMLEESFDAAVGRLVLMYTGDITATLQAAVDRVKPGGVVAFAEADFSSVLGYMRAGPDGANRTMWDWATTTFACAGVPLAMAGPLYRAFVATGLGAPEMALQAPLGGSDGWSGYEWFAASLSSLIPLLEQYGIATAEMLNPESVAVRARAEVTHTGVPLILTPLVTAWARKSPQS